MNDALFKPLDLGKIELGHRVVMAPLTRLRADWEGDLSNELMREYYEQRASQGGLIVTEATTVSPTGRGYLGAPGLYDDAQIAGWRSIVDGVHAKGGKLVSQLWHVGRTSHVSLTGGEAPGTASVVPYEGKAFTTEGWVPSSPPRELSVPEIHAIVANYSAAASRAKEAGFDGVEIHAANGYLIDQFIQDSSNHRKDGYGGTIENRARLLMETVDAARSSWGDGRVAVRLSPSSNFNGMGDSDPDAVFSKIAEMLDSKNLAYLHVVEPRVSGSQEVAEGLKPVAARNLRERFRGPIVAAGGFEGREAESNIEHGDTDAVAFGRHFIANPDLPERLRHGKALNHYDRTTFYGGDAHGYTDYPALETVS